MRRVRRFALLAAAGVGVSAGLTATAHAAPAKVFTVGAAPNQTVAAASSVSFVLSHMLITDTLSGRVDGAVDTIAGVALTSGVGSITVAYTADGDADVVYTAPAPTSFGMGGIGTITYVATTVTEKSGIHAVPMTVTADPAHVTVTVAPARADAPGVTLLAPGATAGNGTVVVAGGLRNLDEFAGSTRTVPGAGFSERFAVSAHSATCDLTVAAPAVALTQGGTGTFSLRANPGSWVLTVRSLTSGLTTQQAFTVPRVGTVRFCTTPTSPLGITAAGSSGSSGPGYVSPYSGTANGALPQGSRTPGASSSTGFSAATQGDQNSAYDAAQAAAGQTGCHSVGTGANAHFVDCDDVTASPGTADAGHSVLTSVPLVVAYVVVALALLMLLAGLARRASSTG